MKIYKYKRNSFLNGILVHSEIISMTENRLLEIMNRKNHYAFTSLLENWNAQGKRANIANMTYHYTDVTEG